MGAALTNQGKTVQTDLCFCKYHVAKLKSQLKRLKATEVLLFVIERELDTYTVTCT